MSHWIIAPVALPAMVAAFLVLAARFDLPLQRAVSTGSAAALLAIAIGLFSWSQDGQPRIYALGNWPMPFGIVLVLDRLSALMLLLTAILGLATAVYATGGWDRQGRHFHPLLQFQLMGVGGAFLTGDIFNLFVFFEVLLIASYGLMLHGGGTRRFGAGIQYITINLIGSTLFLFAVGLIYAVTGTLNMADLALKVATVPPSDQALLRTGALLLLVVFAIKAALVPLHVWLPGTYTAAAPPVAALFAIMSKVGAYAILRVFTLIFGAGAGATAWAAAPWILPAALLTALVGALGLLGARDLGRLAAFALLHSMGTLLIAVGLFDAPSLGAGLYYIVHSTLAAAALFFIVDVVARRRDGMQGRLQNAPPIVHESAIAGLFLLAGMAIAGLPPLSGFVGKLLVLDAARASHWWVWIWAIVLGTSLVAILGFARAGSILFWKSAIHPPRVPARGRAAPPVGVALAAPATLLALLVALTAASGPALVLAQGMAEQLIAPEAYVRAVLGQDARALMPRGTAP
jgi:multicomponent K+:H+ antiporter subunit D